MLVFLNQFFDENKTDHMNGFKGKDVYLCYFFNERNFSILQQCILRNVSILKKTKNCLGITSSIRCSMKAS